MSMSMSMSMSMPGPDSWHRAYSVLYTYYSKAYCRREVVTRAIEENFRQGPVTLGRPAAMCCTYAKLGTPSLRCVRDR